MPPVFRKLLVELVVQADANDVILNLLLVESNAVAPKGRADIASVSLILPRSMKRYSNFADHGPKIRTSAPAPITHPPLEKLVVFDCARLIPKPDSENAVVA